MVLDCRPDQAQDRHIQFDNGETGEDIVVKEGLSAYKATSDINCGLNTLVVEST
jgi:hypothetical protein